MLKMFTLCFALGVTSSAIGQTIITSANTFPAVGYTDTFRVASGSNVGPSGNGVTWDFSAMAANVGGTFSIVAPASTPYAGTFPSATHAVQLNVTGAPAAAYDYYKIDASGWSILASTYSTASPATTYLANDKVRIPFPFAFGNSKTDTFVKAGSSPDAYAITYDGFGTLKLPGKTYNNVVRMKYQWVGGEIAYNWFTTSPLFFVATWSQGSGGQFSFLGNNLPVPTGVNGPEAYWISASLFPNPANGSAFLQIAGLTAFSNMTCVVQDVCGHIVLDLPVTSPLTPISLAGLDAGIYIYEVRQAAVRIAGGKIVLR